MGRTAFLLVVALTLSFAALPSRYERPRGSSLAKVSRYEVVSLDTSHFARESLAVSTQAHTRSQAASGAWSQSRWEPVVASHPETTEFRMHAFDLNMHVVLKKNHDVLHPDYSEEDLHYKDGVLVKRVTRPRPTEAQRCHYHGHVKGSDGLPSIVAVSSCRGGFTGLINAHGDSFYISPAEHQLSRHEIDTQMQRLGLHAAEGTRGSLHVVYRLADYKEEFQCGVGSESPFAHSSASSPEEEHGADAALSWLSGLPLHNIFGFGPEHARGKARVHSATGDKHVELLVVNDNARFLDLGADTLQDTATIVNIVDGLYKATDFQPKIASVTLIGQKTFIEEDPYQLSRGCGGQCGPDEVNVDELISRFHLWRANSANTGPHDNGQLFSGLDFQGGVLGYAGVGSMCVRSQSGGIDQTNFPNRAFSAAIVAHEMGHNFGMRHDSDGNACPPSGLIMNAQVSMGKAPTQFSSCSRTYLTDFMTNYRVDCLDNVPTTRWGDAECGNGFVEEGEECDCNGPDCSQVDPCCDGATCQFVADAECSSTDTCCTSACKIIRDTSTVCRTAVGACDVAETCDGVSGACPVDEFKGAGTACTEGGFGSGACYLGRCMSHLRQCREVGHSFEGAPFDNCPTSTHNALNQGSYCEVLWCTNEPGSCLSFRLSTELVLVADGTPCGTDRQCKDRECVPSAQLTQAFRWNPGPWSNCMSCSEDQTRNFTCQRLATGLTVDLGYCSPSARPATTQKCVNETLGCFHDTTASSEIDLFGYRIAKNTVMFTSLGAVCLFLIILACCYQAVTWGSDEQEGPKKAGELPDSRQKHVRQLPG